MADDDIEVPRRGYNTEDVNAQRGEPRRRRRRWGLIALGLVVGLPLALMALWTWITLTYTYSRGERVGYAQKISEKGWVCKTWEGELAISNVPGQLQERFDYTVRDDSVAAEISRHEGQRVSISYEQHRFIPFSCFGETEYFATGVRPVDQPAPARPLAPQAPATPAAPGATTPPAAPPATPPTTPPPAAGRPAPPSP